MRTAASGAVSAELPLAASVAPGTYTLQTRSEDGELSAQRSLEVFQRTTERLLASIALDQEMVLPGAALTGRVHVSTPSGSPVRGARVSLCHLEVFPVVADGRGGRGGVGHGVGAGWGNGTHRPPETSSRLMVV